MVGDNKSSGVGRPTDYQPEYCEQLVEHMAGNRSMESFAGKLGVSRQTVYNWKKDWPEFEEAFEIGRGKRLIYNEDLMNRMLSGECKGNYGLLIFNLSNIEKELYSPKRDMEFPEQKESSIDLSKLSPETINAIRKDLSK